MSSISAISGVTAASASKESSAAKTAYEETVSASKIRDDFLKLLTTQLSNQNPMEPMDNFDMTMQMASLAELEQMEKVNNYMANLLRSHGVAEGAGMIGKAVEFFPREADGTKSTETLVGVVESVTIYDSEPCLVVGPYKIPFDEVVTAGLPATP
jgi:flagellar basal-body rod modification protein FlgD